MQIGRQKIAIIRPGIRFVTLAILFFSTINSVHADGTNSFPRNKIIALTPVRLSAHVWYFRGTSGVASQANKGFMSNAGFVITDDGVVVYDALATPALGRAMIAAIRKVTDQPIRYVVVGHYHADHIYGLQAFQDIGAKIWARKEGQIYLQSDGAQKRLEQRRAALAPWVDARTRLVAADRWLGFAEGDRKTLILGQVKLVLINAGAAHSVSDMMLLIPDASVLFAGDIFATGRLPFVVDSNTRHWLSAIGKMQAAAPGIVVPGHGSASHHVREDLKLTRDYIQFLRARMGSAVDELLTFEQAYNAINWSAYRNLPAFAESNRRNAYSVFLEMQNELLASP